MGKYSPENQQKVHAHARVIWTLAETRTPDLGLGSTKGVATMTSKVKDFLPTQKIDLEKEDIYSEAPAEGPNCNWHSPTLPDGVLIDSW